jgi:uracil-DNA glycosylase
VTEYINATTDVQREALAHRIAQLRREGVPWDGPGGIVTSLRLVSSATQGRALLRRYKLDAKSGGPVEIHESYDRFEINLATGRRKGWRRQSGKRPPSSEHPPRTGPETHTATKEAAQQPSALSQEAGSSRGDRRHAPIRQLVRRIRSAQNATVPDVDPSGPGVDAAVLVVLRDPGRLGALETQHLSLMNPDRTASNQRRLFKEANLRPEICLFWNAIPWDLGERDPSRADLAAGARYLRELIDLIENDVVTVACGTTARDACRLAGIEAIEICHPSDRGLRGGGVDRELAHVAGLREAARRAAARDPDRRS